MQHRSWSEKKNVLQQKRHKYEWERKMLSNLSSIFPRVEEKKGRGEWIDQRQCKNFIVRERFSFIHQATHPKRRAHEWETQSDELWTCEISGLYSNFTASAHTPVNNESDGRGISWRRDSYAALFHCCTEIGFLIGFFRPLDRFLVQEISTESLNGWFNH